MRYAFFLILPGLLLTCFLACHKTSNESAAKQHDEVTIDKAKQYFQQAIVPLTRPKTGNPRLDADKTPDWSKAAVLSLSVGPAVIVPVTYAQKLCIQTNFGGSKLYSLNELVQLLIYKDATNHYQSLLITGFPDTTAIQSTNFSGIAFVEDWAGHRLQQIKATPDGVLLTMKTQEPANQPTVTPATTTPDVIISQCDQISGYNFSTDDPDEQYAWSEPAGCNNYYFPDPITSPIPSLPDLRRALSTVPLASLNVASGSNPIANIQDYFKCFTNVGGTDHKYSVTVCVDQPEPGTREPWTFSNGVGGTLQRGNPFDVGHTFLVFTESYGGTTITRNVGFYPKTNVNPKYPTDQGQLDDNESSLYDISLSITVNDAQFFNVLNYVSQGNNPGFLYDLNSNNCTSFALGALNAGGVVLSTKTGTWLGGSGDDPGDLGEDIRNMALQSNMTRSTTESAHPNTGNCN
jgi:hypothetical protein